MGRPTSFFGMPVLDKRHGHNHAGFWAALLVLIDLHCLGWVRFCDAFRADGGGQEHINAIKQSNSNPVFLLFR
jgi:hypothetical protein